MDLTILENNLYEATKEFSSNLKNIRSKGCMDALYSKLLGAKPVLEARKIYERGDLDKKTYKKLRGSFKAGLEGFYSFSKGAQHIISKPYGYPGDFAILEMVYDKKSHPETQNSAAKIVDTWGLNKKLPNSVLERKNSLRYLLEEYAREKTPIQKILSIASGSARELADMDPSLIKKFDITLVDFDQKSLKFAESRLSTRPDVPNINLVMADVFNDTDFYDKIGDDNTFDIIYSFGLFDYLPDHYLIDIMKKFTPYLKQSGKFIFCLKDRRYYDAFIYDWLFNWKFIPRVFDDGLRLAEAFGFYVNETFVVDGQTIIIYECSLKK